MNATKAKRRAALLPRGVPRYVRCYRDDSCPLDAFTVIFTGRAAKDKGHGAQPDQWPYVGRSGHGFTNHQPADTLPKEGTGYVWPPAVGRKCHLGVRVKWRDLPARLRAVALADYRAIWRIE